MEYLEAEHRKHAERFLQDTREILQRAVVIVQPENPNAVPLAVFPSPQELRASDKGLDLNEVQTDQLLSVVLQFGFGRQSDKTLSEQGLSGANVIIEGGQPHKIEAEVQLVLDDVHAQPKRLFFAASPHREVGSEAEQQSCQRLYGQIGKTEYDVAKLAIENLPGFRAEEYDLPFGYDIHNDYALINQETGQFKMAGWLGKIPIILMAVNRDEDAKAPETAEIIGLVDAVQKQEDDLSQPLALVTSSTYETSRAADAYRAELSLTRLARVVSFGTERLAQVKGMPPAPGPINQLPGELYQIASRLQKLAVALDSA